MLFANGVRQELRALGIAHLSFLFEPLILTLHRLLAAMLLDTGKRSIRNKMISGK